MKKTINLLTISFFLACNAIAQIPTNGLVGYWPFTGNANDISGNGNNGIVNGASLTIDRLGNTNSAYLFNGSSDILLNNTGLIDFSQGITFSAWIKPTAVKMASIIDKMPACNGTNGFRTNIRSNGQVHSGNGCYGSGASAVANVNYQINNWYFVVGTYGLDDSLRIYINGGLTGTFYTSTSIINSKNIEIGQGSLSSNYEQFEGVIDEVGVWNRELTPSEIAGLYTGCNGAPISTINAIGNTTFCQGSNAILNVNETYSTYQWQRNNVNINGATNKTYTSTTGGNYRCIVSNACGVDTSNVIKLTMLSNVANTVVATGSTSFCIGDSVVLNSSNTTPGYTYQWYRNNISINGATSSTFSGKNPGTYKVVARNSANGCSRISSNSAVVAVTCRTTNREAFTGNVEPVKNILLYPNPNEGSFKIEIANPDIEDGNATIQIMNINGQVVFNGSAEFTNGLLQQNIDLDRNFSKGLYFVKVQINGQEMTEKVMLQ